MANQYGLFWNSQNGDRLYDADSFSELFQKFFTTGVFNGDLQVVSTGGMDVTVQTGYCCINGKVRFFDTADQITISPASGTYPRIDTIVIERDDTNRTITIKSVTGSYSGTNPEPTEPVRAGGIYQIVLAQIYVGVGVVELTQADITDKRPDTDVCGWVVGTVDEVDVEQMTAQAQADFMAWYQEMKDQLSEDAAGHLQEEIDALSEDLDWKVLDVTLTASSWSNNQYTVTNSALTLSKVKFLSVPLTITDAQREAISSASIVPIAEAEGSITLKAINGAPTINVPIQIVIGNAQIGA